MKIPDLANSPAMQRMLRVLEVKSHMSVSDISAEAFVGVTTLACGGYVKSLKARQLIFISGWRKVKGRFSSPLYSLGHLADVPRPKVDETTREAPGMQNILETLRRFGNLSYRDIARFSGLSLNTLKNSGYLSALVAQQEIHVGSWQRSQRGPMMPIYHLGPGLAADKPAPVSASEKSKIHRDRKRIAGRKNDLEEMTNSLCQLQTR